ncbi:MAG: hypothetical protein JNJ98_16830 [Gemmatimonadetes bacterium]|nr:hypothetical protein [Gemmatimonadota bacterium]
MRTRFVVGLLAGAVACGGAGDATLSSDLKADLEATKSTFELANQAAGAQPMRFVSDLEQGKASEPVERTRTPRRVASQTTGPTPEEQTSPAPEARQETQVAETQSVAQQAPQPVPEISSVPMVAPRPASLPVEIPADGGGRGLGAGGIGTGDGGAGIGIGEVIGVVIRGGAVGPDHCPPRGRRPRGRIFP